MEDGIRKTLSRKKPRTWYLACHIAWLGILDISEYLKKTMDITTKLSKH